MPRKPSIFITFFFIFIILVGAFIYTPGLRGGFLFDDHPNLAPLGNLGGIKDWESFRTFVSTGIAGPLGRPVALASFVLDADFWPSSAEPFKRTNLLLHLFTGLCLCWATLNLLRLYGVAEARACWAAVLNMAFWLLHPYMVSTTLYIVQRMAQLATLFIFAGLAGYLYGRLILSRHKIKGYLWMSCSLACGTILAAFSKENGVLLPLLALVIEWCKPPSNHITQHRHAPFFDIQPDWRWRAVFLWLPSLAILLQLALEINLSPNAWPTRPFNQVERLLTEPRILWEYLYHLYIPRIEGAGLFQDGYTISTNLLEPITTLPSLLGILALIFLAIFIRKKHPYGTYIALALLFFFASHLIESTVVGLELYFEHRNYAAAAFLFLPLVMLLIWIAERKSRFIAITALGTTLGMLSFLTWQRTTLWSDTEALQNYWAVASPNSPRAQNHLAVQWFQNGQPEKGFAHLEAAAQRMPQSSLLSMQWLLQKVLRQQATSEDFEHVRRNLPNQRFDAQAVLGMRLIVETLLEPDARPQDRQQALAILDVMQSLPQYRAVPLFNRLEPYLRGLLLIAKGEPDAAAIQLSQAIKRYRDVEAALSMVAHMGNAGYPHQALQLLDAARKVYAQQPERTLKRSKATYDMEINRLHHLLLEDASTLEILKKHDH